MVIDKNKLRVAKIKDYLIEIVDKIEKNRGVNVNALSKETNTYSLDKIPTNNTVEKWVTGLEIHKDVYLFRSRRNYSYKEIENLLNIGFFEIFEQEIFENNRKGILPKIEGIEKIECLNCGTLVSVETNTAEFEIQIQVTFKIGGKYEY